MRVYTDDKRLIEVEESDRDGSMISMKIFNNDALSCEQMEVTMMPRDAANLARALISAEEWAIFNEDSHG